jgi:tetratricopeptide (TPR) repeat protein
VKGIQRELETLVEDVKGHALTLNLLSTYLRDAHGGDIRKRDLVKLQDADAEEQGGHAFRVMDAYVRWLEGPQPGSRARQSAPSAPVEDQRRLTSAATEEEARGQRALALLRLMGLFDRPATADCLEAVWRAPVIVGLTEPLVELSEVRRNLAFSWLEAAKLLTVNREGSGMLVSVDAHPLLREYFATDLKQRSGETTPRAEIAGTIPSVATTAWCEAHRRIYEHLCATTPDKLTPTLEDLQPLYQAVVHGCMAGSQQGACDKVYRDRILRRNEAYSVMRIGAFGSDLEAVSHFFRHPWSLVSAGLNESAQAWLLSQAGFRLRALGRLNEALEPLRASVKKGVLAKDWEEAARRACNLSELDLALGDVAGAAADAEQAVTYADRSGDSFLQTGFRTTFADSLHQAGCRAEADSGFREAEQMQEARQPDYPLLYSTSSFQYCDFLLSAPEQASWQNCTRILRAGSLAVPPGGSGGETPPEPAAGTAALMDSCRAVSERAALTLKWAKMRGQGSLLDIALNHLTLSRAALYAAIIGSRQRKEANAPSDAPNVRLVTSAATELDTAVAGFHCAGTQYILPHGLLTRSWLRFLTGARTGPESAQEDLDEAWEIAERGPMRLHMADIHLHRARLFFREGQYPWESPAADLAAAENLIHQCGYHRRDEELADAKRAILAR